MLTYKNNNLSINTNISKADSILKLTTDIEATYTGVLTLSNKTFKTISFIKDKDIYKARLLITEEDLPYLSSCTFHLCLANSSLFGSTNSEKILFDIPKVKQTIKISKSQDIRDIKIELSKLTTTINMILSNIPTISTTNIDISKANIKPGMIPVTIDETGRCVFQYPFIDHVTEINGQKTTNSAILLTAKDIPIEQTDVESAIKAQTNAIKELNSYLKTLSSGLKQVTNKVATIEQQLLQHTDSSII